MSVAVTSIEAYRRLQESGHELSQIGKVALYIAHHPGCTRWEIATITGLSEGRVAARVNKLVEMQWVREEGVRYNHITHAYSKCLYAVEGENLKLSL